MLAVSTINDWWSALSSAPLTGVAIVLVITGTLKAARPLRTVPTMRALGLPANEWLVVALGGLEVVAGVLATGGFTVAMVMVGVLYAAFAVVVARLRRLPDPVSCGCLGTETGRPGPDHLVANCLAVVAAIVATASSYRDYWTFTEADDYGHVALALIVAALMLMVIAGVFRRHEHPSRVSTHEFTGALVPLIGVHPDGQEVEVAIGTQPTVLAFFSSTCVTCASLWPEAGRARLGARRRLVIVARDPAEERLDKIASMNPDEVVIVMSSAGWADYGIEAGPVFVVTGEGTPYVFTATNWPAVRATVKAGHE